MASPVHNLRVNTDLAMVTIVVIFFNNYGLIFSVLHDNDPKVGVHLAIVNYSYQLQGHNDHRGHDRHSRRYHGRHSGTAKRAYDPLHVTK